ncbi:hypothetical protein NLI96_g1955 [Meripilus lineatus]|uniref:Protein kinase domain-containing protein n=1 Tax=Meripilus lineatus TaxID=2056292 RepID=A0AAD5V9M0_9APHY|nr:hypothetical protein NLI96_g1955 [Physisporinus lineatus]
MFPQACDLSARTDNADDQLARKILCLLLDVQPIGESRHTTDDYTDVYPGVYEGLPVDLKVMQGYGAQILDSRPFRKDVALWRTLPPSEAVHPFLGVSLVTVYQRTHICLISPKVEGETLAQHVRTLMRGSEPPYDFEIVPLIIGWVHGIAHGLLHLHSNDLVLGRLCGNTVLLSPNGHIQLLGFGSKVYDHADVVTEFTSKSDVAFLAPELLDDSSEKSVELPSFASDVWAFGCVCVELFNEGNSPYNDVGDIDIKRRVKQGCHLPHTMTIPDDIWAIAERCWDMSAKRRPSMRVLVDELTEAQKRSRGFLTSVLTSLASIPSNNADRQGVLEEVLLLARNRNLREILEFKDSNAQHAFDILHEILLDCYSGRYNLPMGTRSTLRILLVELASVADIVPRASFVSGVEITPRFKEHIKTGFAYISIGTLQARKVAIKSLRAFNWSIERFARKATKELFIESIVWKTLSHKHILPFIGIDFECFGFQPTMVSLWMENGTARKYVEQAKGQGREFRALVNKLLHQTALAVEFLHGEDIAHGDLRGGNILVDPEGNAVLTDFGIAVLYGPGDTHFSVSSHDGDPSYISPERLNPASYGDDYLERKYNRYGNLERLRTPPSLRSDIYAFGCLCVELYACEEPYGPMPRLHVARAVMNKASPKRPKRKGDEMTDVLWKLVGQCLERDDLSKRLTAKQVVEARIIDMV